MYNVHVYACNGLTCCWAPPAWTMKTIPDQMECLSFPLLAALHVNFPSLYNDTHTDRTTEVTVNE